jgi:hypothetical protein
MNLRFRRRLKIMPGLWGEHLAQKLSAMRKERNRLVKYKVNGPDGWGPAIEDAIFR